MINATISDVYPSLKPWCLLISVDKVHLNLSEVKFELSHNL